MRQCVSRARLTGRRDCFLDAAHAPPQRFDFFLAPRFSLLTFAAAVEPLRVANWLVGRELYSWCLISQDGAPCLAANGIPIPADAAVADVVRSKVLILCASVGMHVYREKNVIAWVRRLGRSGTRIGSIGAGAYLMARAGLLGDRPCTLHWQEHETFREQFPNQEISSAIYEISGNTFSCAGGTAAIDLMLQIISEQYGRDFAGSIAEQFINSGVRDGDINQRMRTQVRTGISDTRVLKAIEAMEANIEHPLAIPDICKLSGISMRHLQRVFQTVLHCSPQQYYLEMRLRLARQRLLHCTDPVLNVAVSAGFSSASHFCRKYHEFFGYPPKEERLNVRRQIAGPLSGQLHRPA
jgi:transcriptional regulator GlxA family with amidase domain